MSCLLIPFIICSGCSCEKEKIPQDIIQHAEQTPEKKDSKSESDKSESKESGSKESNSKGSDSKGSDSKGSESKGSESKESGSSESSSSESGSNASGSSESGSSNSGSSESGSKGSDSSGSGSSESGSKEASSNGSSSYPGATGTGNTGYDISKSDVPHDFQSDKGKAESILKNARKLGSQGKYGAAYGEAASVLTLISPYKDKPEGKALIKECQNFMQECAFKVPQSDLTDDEKPNAIQ